MDRELVLQLDVPSSPEFIAIVRLVVASVASDRRALAEERIDDLKLAVSEACTNAIKANRSVNPKAPVHVEVWEAPDRMEVTVEDSGPGFDPDQVEYPPAVTDPQRLHFERGLGIPLMRMLVDSAEFTGTDTGTSVQMTLFGGPANGDDTATIYMDVSKVQGVTPLE